MIENQEALQELQEIRAQLNAIDTAETLRKLDDLERRMYALKDKIEAYEQREEKRRRAVVVAG